VLESLFGVALGKLLGKALDWLFPNRSRRSNEDSQPAVSQPAVVVNPGVPPEFAEQSNATARELGRMETENAWLRSENAELRKARDAAIADLERRSHTADDPSRFERAVTEVKKGHPEAAEALFRDIIMESRREAAYAAYSIGALAFRHDTQKALYAFQESAILYPDNLNAWIGVGHLQRRMGDLEASESTFDTLLHIGNSNDNDVFRAAALSNLGIVFGIRGDLDMAKNKFMAALKLNQKLGNQENMARNYCNIGNVLSSSGDSAGAEEMYRKSLDIDEELGNKENVAVLYINLGVVLEKRGDLDGAEEMYRKSLGLSELLGHKEVMAGAYGNLGVIFERRGDLIKAERMLHKALRIYEDMGHKEGMATSYVNLGTISEDRGDLAEACRWWKKARDLFSDLSARNKVELVEQKMQEAGCEL